MRDPSKSRTWASGTPRSTSREAYSCLRSCQCRLRECSGIKPPGQSVRAVWKRSQRSPSSTFQRVAAASIRSKPAIAAAGRTGVLRTRSAERQAVVLCDACDREPGCRFRATRSTFGNVEGCGDDTNEITAEYACTKAGVKLSGRDGPPPLTGFANPAALIASYPSCGARACPAGIDLRIAGSGESRPGVGDILRDRHRLQRPQERDDVHFLLRNELQSEH
jgi:hypothetical protein